MNVLRAEAYMQRLGASERLADLYDDDDMLRDAMSTLFPGFEYPDVSHLTIGQLLTRYAKNPQPIT